MDNDSVLVQNVYIYTSFLLKKKLAIITHHAKSECVLSLFISVFDRVGL